jgi:virginiamycin B lyase
LPASAILSLLPDGEEKRRFIRDCTGCHGLDARVAYPEGKARARESWVEKTALMLSFAGPSSNFPVIGAGREPEATADFLTRHIRDGASFGATPRADAAAAGATITEYAIPEAGDLPHDLAALPDGRVLITGMFTHRMYLLNPETGTFETEAIPVENANPRAVELGDDGAWWVVLGNPRALARRDADSGEWTSWTVGTYPHSLGVARDGRVWFNGHFSRNPEVLGWLDAATGEVTRLDVPAHPQAGEGAGPIPYELRVAPDGRIWGSELVGDRVFAYQPANGQFQVWPMPGPVSGPRRLDVAPDGSVWIPEYAAGYLTRLDPANGRFERFAVPVADAAPYIARVDARTGRVWLGTGAADAIFAFDPASGRWTTYPLPSRATLVRHLAIDPRTGDLWIAYGASPGPPSKVARLRVRTGS